MNRRMKFGTGALAVAVAGGLALIGTPSAQADTYQGSTTAAFSTVTDTSGPGEVTHIDVSNGNPTSSITFGDASLSTNYNVLTFTGLNFDVNAGTPFSLGSLDYYNGFTHDGTRTIPITVNITFTAPPGISPNPANFDYTFNLNVTYGSNVADTLTPGDPTGPTIFTVGSTQYTLSLLGFGDSPSNIASDFTLVDGQHSLSNLYAQISPVPTPAALPLGLALMGFIGTRRRKRQMA